MRAMASNHAQARPSCAARPARRAALGCALPTPRRPASARPRPAGGPAMPRADSPLARPPRVATPDVMTETAEAAARHKAPTPAPQGQPSPGAAFSWTRQWYAVAVADDLERDRPHPITILGGRYVLWHSAGPAGGWTCQVDMCPHRLAPLSEGKIVGDALQCSYHGWQFNGAGDCVRVPQAPEHQAHAACGNKRACVTTLPTRVEHGLLWVWPDASPDRVEASAAQPVAQDGATPPAGDGGLTWHTFLPWYAREFPYSMQTLFDNALDPSHVPWSHHGVIGDRTQAGPIEMKVVTGVEPSGMTVLWDARKLEAAPTINKDRKLRAEENEGSIRLHFKAPHTLMYETMRNDGTQARLLAYVTPTTPGRCLVLSQQWDTRLSLMNRLSTPEWLAHLIFMVAGDGDIVLLKEQEELLPRVERGWRAFYMPTKADTMVSLWRQWLDRYASSPSSNPYMLAPPGEQAAPSPMAREQLLDRFNQHVRHCPSCKGAMRNFQVATWAAAAGAVLCAQLALLSALGLLGSAAAAAPAAASAPAAAAVTGVLAWASPLLAWASGLLASVPAHIARAVGLAAAAAALAAAARFCADMRQSFVFKDYVHATI
ncbi:MAG: hypothetical protein J3K34DRAFT_237978 [Monoraphidium minutum]|nr:MAG: hypothetical protein J3K34DRAFT_237978 [Monoraphidium minutum]